MRYIVVSCCEREIHLEMVCDTYMEAYEVMKACFLDYHRDCGYTEKEIERLEFEIEADSELANLDYGFVRGITNVAWSNVDHDYGYDIKIFEIF